MTRLPATLIAIIAGMVLCGGVQASVSGQAAYCSGMYRCLQEKPKGCSDEDCLAEKDTPYSEAYCAIFKELQERGLRSTSPNGRQVYRQVAGRHRVEYKLTGKLPMPASVMVHLMNDLPFAAQLINAYQGTTFQAAYLDKIKKRFSASGESMSGTFTTLLQNEQQTRSLYHGSGTAEVLVWKLRGTALIMLDFEETGPREIAYSLRCMVFPHSAFVKSILNFGLFRNSIVAMLDRTFRRVQDSAMAFHRGERAAIESYPAFCTPKGRQQIEEFQLLLQRTMQDAEPAPAPAVAAPQQAVQEPTAAAP